MSGDPLPPAYADTEIADRLRASIAAGNLDIPLGDPYVLPAGGEESVHMTNPTQPPSESTFVVTAMDHATPGAGEVVAARFRLRSPGLQAGQTTAMMAMADSGVLGPLVQGLRLGDMVAIRNDAPLLPMAKASPKVLVERASRAKARAAAKRARKARKITAAKG